VSPLRQRVFELRRLRRDSGHGLHSRNRLGDRVRIDAGALELGTDLPGGQAAGQE
jgi:hypothetical protein